MGRDLLTGALIGTALGLLEKSNDIVPPLFGYPARLPTSRAVETLAGAAPTLDFIWSASVNSIVVAVFLVLGYVVLRLTLRRTSLTVAAAVILVAIVQAPQALTSDTVWWIAAIEQAIIVAAATTMVVRYGLLVTAVALAVVNIIANVPLTFALSQWTATTSNITLATVIGLALFGFYASRAGQPLFGKITVMADG